MVSFFRKTANRFRLQGKAHKWKRILLIILLVAVVFVGLVILFVSPLTKYLVEKYDVQYTGREIEMD
ncbi:MAG TPA: hypothetical protein VFG54_12955, partial [Prolixibacteraceae bacterium]|nr:hypothetical protein [Prolixibacteraceae bacterium]